MHFFWTNKYVFLTPIEPLQINLSDDDDEEEEEERTIIKFKFKFKAGFEPHLEPSPSNKMPKKF